VIPARATVITLGARDLDRLRRFYRGLGWTVAIDLEGFAALETEGAVVALFPLEDLAADAAAPAAVPERGLRGFSISINVDQPEQVDQVINAVREAGGRITKEPVTADWGGRSAYFADPEDNHWEVAWVPPDSNMAALVRRATG
jgi:catechol 2,3-dioxygenase-like lactoylglutathione lyase family enzyme